MKICVLSHARCRSSLLVRTLSNAYTLENFQEEYETVKQFTYKERQIISKSENKKIQTLEVYTNRLENFTEKLFSTNNDFVIKIWPRFFNANQFCYNTEFLVKNLQKGFNFQNYDKIILSDRNLLDAVCSLSLAIKYGYNYTDKNLAEYYTKRRYENFHFNQVSLHSWNKSFIVEILLLQRIREYFDKNNIPYTYVKFDDIPDYVCTLPKSQTSNYWHMTIDTKIDYSKAVVNYESLQLEVEKYKQEMLPILNSIAF